MDLAKTLKTRFTFDPAEDRYPVWSPDGSGVVFSSLREGTVNLYSKPSNGATNEEVLRQIERSEDSPGLVARRQISAVSSDRSKDESGSVVLAHEGG